MDPFCYYVQVCLFYTVMSVPCSIVITCWEKSDLLDLLFVVFPCVIVTLLHGVLDQMWYLVVSSPDLCFPFYFHGLSY